MSKEKQILEYEKKQLIDELSKMSLQVIATAYLHAVNYTLYGEDVTEKWETTVQNASALEKAYIKGYDDALKWIPVSEKPPKENETVIASTKYGVCPEAKYTKENGWHWVSESGVKNYWTELDYVEAWMPLPKRYVATKNFLAGSSLEIRPMNIDIKTESEE